MRCLCRRMAVTGDVPSAAKHWCPTLCNCRQSLGISASCVHVASRSQMSMPFLREEVTRLCHRLRSSATWRPTHSLSYLERDMLLRCSSLLLALCPAPSPSRRHALHPDFTSNAVSKKQPLCMSPSSLVSLSSPNEVQ